MAHETRTSLRLSTPRRQRLKELQRQFSFPSQDEVIGFLIDISSPGNLAAPAAQHLSNIRRKEAKRKSEEDRVKRLVSGLSDEELARLVAGATGAASKDG